MCATTSALLVDDGFADLGDLAGLFNGIFDGDKNAGYIGDIFGTNANYTNNQINKTAADFFRSLLLSSNEFIEM